MKSQKQQLIQLFEGLNQQGRDSLLDYAEYLQNKNGQVVEAESLEKKEPLFHPRPQDESVINAIKRLRTSYFMIDTDAMISETSSLMTQFMLQGREASDVIDDLERLFNDHYQKYLDL